MTAGVSGVSNKRLLPSYSWQKYRSISSYVFWQSRLKSAKKESRKFEIKVSMTLLSNVKIKDRIVVLLLKVWISWATPVTLHLITSLHTGEAFEKELALYSKQSSFNHSKDHFSTLPRSEIRILILNRLSSFMVLWSTMAVTVKGNHTGNALFSYFLNDIQTFSYLSWGSSIRLWFPHIMQMWASSVWWPCEIKHQSWNCEQAQVASVLLLLKPPTIPKNPLYLKTIFKNANYVWIQTTDFCICSMKLNQGKHTNNFIFFVKRLNCRHLFANKK